MSGLPVQRPSQLPCSLKQSTCSRFYDCLDVAVQQVNAGDPRVGWDWSDLSDQEKSLCDPYGAQTTTYFDCLESIRTNKASEAE